jgi:hypothetical protein
MTRRPSTFRKQDVRRAIEGARAAGVEVQRIEIEAGKIVVVARGENSAVRQSPENEWDNVK